MSPSGAGRVLALLLLAVATGPAGAQAPAEPPAYTPKGADTCLRCHDEDSKFPVLAIFKTPHGQRHDARAPFAQLQCESCHGPGNEHARKRPAGEPPGPIVNFGVDEGTPVDQQNRVCLGCHQGSERGHWQGSEHEAAGVPCASCHVVHAATDPVRVKSSQSQICGTCHTRERAQSLTSWAHPLREGLMGCSDCHEPHGGSGDALLRGSVNDTCHACHSDKRGPFLWEHAPASEDCTLCHAPHGSPHRAMLTQRPPLLCQQCHSEDGHPGRVYTPGALPPGGTSAFVVGSSCANCHSQVHGSNHPSGAGLTR